MVGGSVDAVVGDNLGLQIGLSLFLMLCSGFFAAAETALTGASRARLHALENEGNARARLVNKLRNRKERLIGALLLGNTLLNVLASALATAAIIHMMGPAGIVYATFFITILVFIFAEVLPKTVALVHADRMALAVAPLVAFFVAIFSPILYTVEVVVNKTLRLARLDKSSMDSGAQEEELRGAIDLFKDAIDVDEDQEKGAMLRSILDLANVKVEEIMVHRKNVRMINQDWPTAKIVDEVLHSAFTRLPVWKESQDNIVGVIHAKLLLQELRTCGGDVSKLDVKKVMMDPWFIPESTTLFDQLQAFRKRREHFAVMVDEYGSLIGVITLEDILEEIVGQIDDEHDVAVSGVHPQPDGSYVVDGNVTIRDLNREMDWGLPDEDYSTVAGLLLFESQRIPSVGQTYTFYDFRFDILKKQRNQITSIKITPPSKHETTDKEALARANA